MPAHNLALLGVQLDDIIQQGKTNEISGEIHLGNQGLELLSIMSINLHGTESLTQIR